MDNPSESLIIGVKRSDNTLTFSLYKGKPLITNKGRSDIAAHIVREYPGIAEEVVEADKNSLGADINGFDLSGIQPSQRVELINLIVQKFNTRKKTTNNF
jgi:hypothetical protein